MKEKRIDYMSCLNMGFFIYVLLLVAFIIVLSTMNYYQKNPILLHLSYIEDTEKSAAKAAITMTLLIVIAAVKGILGAAHIQMTI